MANASTPAWVVPGGVAAPLEAETRDQILAALPEARAATERALDWYKTSVQRFAEEAARFGDFPSAFMGLVGPDGSVEHYDGTLRVVGADGAVLAERPDPRPYWEYLGEAVEPWSYLKSAYWKDLGYPDGVYRVGPLARLNVADRMGTPRADEELEEFRGRLGRTPAAPSTTTRPGSSRSCLPGAAGGAARRPGDPVAPGPLDGRHQPRGRHRRGRGAPGHAAAPLPGRR